jgi:KaiC/GvpD/RAD55 family RecA-like ATPase
LKLEGNTLLIKGYAGAGKTTLALQLLDQLAPKGGGIYVSSRVSESKIHKELPWTEFGQRKGGAQSHFDDLRLGSPAVVLEEVVKAMSKKGPEAPPVLVLDTWDGIAKELGEAERLKAEKMLIAAADSSRARTIFVSEEPERTTMDYLVDGMVEMKRDEQYGRIFREIEVQKLRGTLIEQHKYLYTLEGGRFTLIPPYQYSPVGKARPPEPVPDSDGYVSFGSPSLDNVFGGIRKGTTITMTFDENVPYSALRLLTIPAMINALNTGRAVFDVPLSGTTSSEVADAIRPFVKADVFRNCLAIGAVGAESTPEPPLYAINGAQPKEASARVNEIISTVKSRSQSKSVLIVEALGIFETLFASRLDSMVESIGQRVGSVHSSGTDILFFLIAHDSAIASRTLAASSRYARLLTKDRSVVIFGEKPGTPAYAIDHSSENSLLAKLTLIA